MALGEYVSVHSQKDAEVADIARERAEFLKSPEAFAQEERELALIYQAKGLSADLAAQVASQLHSKHLDEIVKIHARDELGIDTEDLANPLQAALMSALTFAVGALIPLLSGSFIADPVRRIICITVVASVGLFLFGVVGAVVGGAPWVKAAFRVLIGGWIAMGGTFGIGRLFGATVG
jgi:VIT1/CCC1 family predicted Fe2+/Mn2+ transporter